MSSLYQDGMRKKMQGTLKDSFLLASGTKKFRFRFKGITSVNRSENSTPEAHIQ